MVVNGVGRRNRVLVGRAHWRHPVNTVERLRTASMSGSVWPPGVATRPVAKLLWEILFNCEIGLYFQLFHTAYMLCYRQHSRVDVVELKPSLSDLSSFSALTLLVGSFDL